MNPGSEVAREARVRARDCQKELLDKRKLSKPNATQLNSKQL